MSRWKWGSSSVTCPRACRPRSSSNRSSAGGRGAAQRDDAGRHDRAALPLFRGRAGCSRCPCCAPRRRARSAGPARDVGHAGAALPPGLLAEELATLDIVSGGRLDVGLGTGYMPEEFEALGVPFEERVPRLEECIGLLEALWTSDRVTFEGRFWTFHDAPVHLRPVQEPDRPSGSVRSGRPESGGRRVSATRGRSRRRRPRRCRRVGGAVRRGALSSRAGRSARSRCVAKSSSVGDRADAASRAASMGREWHQNMVDIRSPASLPAVSSPRSRTSSARGFCGRLRRGLCPGRFAPIGDLVPVDPVITRANWPGMSTDQAVAYIDSLGQELVPALREYEPVPQPAGHDA